MGLCGLNKESHLISRNRIVFGIIILLGGSIQIKKKKIAAQGSPLSVVSFFQLFLLPPVSYPSFEL